ncbi:MAG: hypothetical protein SH859_15445 [Hyphomicrobium aestuarii]|nr:hypothetical protein [Hyphomicrobium aestuarii]
MTTARLTSGRSGLPYLAVALALTAAWFAVPPEEALAQSADPQRNCQTIRNCRFDRGGSFRGCVSSYSCRTCSFEPAKCSIAGSNGPCRKQVCRWG